MTDLISKLADAILALINAQPRSPTKAEIMEVLKSVPEIAHPLLFAGTDEKTAKAWAELYKLDREVFEIMACDILNSGEAGTEKNRDNGGLSSLWGNQDRANPHPEATQAARETYTASGTYSKPTSNTVTVEVQGGGHAWRPLSTQELADIVNSRTAKFGSASAVFSDGEYLADDGSAVFAEPFTLQVDPAVLPCRYYGEKLGHKWVSFGMDKHGLLCQPGDTWDTLAKPVNRCACGATEPDKC